MIKCPFCREKYTIDFDYNDLKELIERNLGYSEVLPFIKNTINDIIKNANEEIINRLKIIIEKINVLTQNISEDNMKLKGLYSMFNYKTKNINELSNAEMYNVKGEQNWDAFVVNKLINKQYDLNNETIIFNNILIKAALVGIDGAYWAYTNNFNIQPFEFLKFRDCFNLKEINLKFLFLEGKKYNIINFKSGFSLELKEEEGEKGATIAKTQKSIIFGIYNTNIDYRKNGENYKQNGELCTKIVEEFAKELMELNF